MSQEQMVSSEMVQDLPPSSGSTGPRMFEGNFRPSCLCKMWIQHPTYCAHGDSCSFAHGLAEMSTDLQMGLETLASTGLFGAKAAMVGEAFKGKGKAATGKGKPGQAVTIYAAVQTNGKGMGVGMGPTNGANGKGMNGKGMNGKGMDGKGMDGKGMAAVNAAAAPAGSRFGDSFMPTRICSFWLKDPGACLKGDACSFAHGVAELHPNSVQECGVSRFLHTGFTPRVMCKNIHSEHGCYKGLWCTYAHSAEEMA
ncbi:unnamed protein product [Symbiodinium pilosum]|uniref:C3H1-type domain-containing protein n=1 Tax=Symbiodinium pilosum TaxID=2952 RepID=A0A812XY36_SYMPI|nr:unnamed protein product [Symbiodinium pilosum]